MNPRRRRSVSIRLVSVAVATLLGACASDPPDVADPGTSPPTTHDTTPDTEAPSGDSGRGWIDGEPEWHATYGEADAAGGDGAPLPAEMSETYTEAAAEASAPSDIAPEPGPQSDAPLRAGSVDDNADFAAFLEYLDRIDRLGIATRDFDPAGRVVVSVTGASGLPVAGAEVKVTSGGDVVIATLRTTANGTARFLPALYGQRDVASFDFTSGGVTASAAPGGDVHLDVTEPGGATAPIALDVLFLLDATGSMGDEIDRLKTTIDSVAARLAAFESQPDLHLAMTLYRDEGDTFVTSTFDFTADVDAFRTALEQVAADGGGDYPEALEEGLAESLQAPAWRDPASTVQLVFLIADAPPRLDRQVPTPYPAAVVDAVARGIKVFPIASSESDDQAEAVFRQIAAATGARFVFLSYGAAGAATGESTDIESTDYEELALDDLIVRLVAEELSALTGDDPGVPPTTVPETPPTNPDGQ